jgi:hypothetical protein
LKVGVVVVGIAVLGLSMYVLGVDETGGFLVNDRLRMAFDHYLENSVRMVRNPQRSDPFSMIDN